MLISNLGTIFQVLLRNFHKIICYIHPVQSKAISFIRKTNFSNTCFIHLSFFSSIEKMRLDKNQKIKYNLSAEIKFVYQAIYTKRGFKNDI